VLPTWGEKTSTNITDLLCVGKEETVVPVGGFGQVDSQHPAGQRPRLAWTR